MAKKKREHGPDGKFVSDKVVENIKLGQAQIEHAGLVAVGLFAGIDPQLLADSVVRVGGSIQRMTKRAGTLQLWIGSTQVGVGVRLAEALRAAGVKVDLKAAV